jgi:hypothetical protein
MAWVDDDSDGGGSGSDGAYSDADEADYGRAMYGKDADKDADTFGMPGLRLDDPWTSPFAEAFRAPKPFAIHGDDVTLDDFIRQGRGRADTMMEDAQEALAVASSLYDYGTLHVDTAAQRPITVREVQRARVAPRWSVESAPPRRVLFGNDHMAFLEPIRPGNVYADIVADKFGLRPELNAFYSTLDPQAQHEPGSPPSHVRIVVATPSPPPSPVPVSVPIHAMQSPMSPFEAARSESDMTPSAFVSLTPRSVGMTPRSVGMTPRSVGMTPRSVGMTPPMFVSLTPQSEVPMMPQSEVPMMPQSEVPMMPQPEALLTPRSEGSEDVNPLMTPPDATSAMPYGVDTTPYSSWGSPEAYASPTTSSDVEGTPMAPAAPVTPEELSPIMGVRSMFVDTPPLQTYAANPYSAPTSPVGLSEVGDDTDFGPMGQDFNVSKQGQAPSQPSWFAHMGTLGNALDTDPDLAAAAPAAGGRRRHGRSGAVEKQIQYDPTTGKWTVVDVGHSSAHSDTDTDTDTASDSDSGTEAKAKDTARGGRLTQRFKDVSYPLFK